MEVGWFGQAVDPKQVPGYEEVVQHPMCFDMIKEALQKDRYQLFMKLQQQQQQEQGGQQQQQQQKKRLIYSWHSLVALAHDVQLIVSDARLFNGPRAKHPVNMQVLKAAEGLQQQAAELWAQAKVAVERKVKEHVPAQQQKQQQRTKPGDQ